MNKLLMVCLLLLTRVVWAQELPDELMAEGVVVGQGQCSIPALSPTKMDCFQVKMKGELYVALGQVDGRDFYMKYIGKMVNGQYVVVWSYKPERKRESQVSV